MKKSVSSDEYEKPKRTNRLFDYVHIQYIHIYMRERRKFRDLESDSH